MIEELLSHLHRGGEWFYLWRKHDKRSRYLRVCDPLPPIRSSDVYFSVHPLKVKRGEYERGRVEDVAAVNCLYCEYDIKDCGSEEGIETVLQNRAVLWPTVVVHSGGGWHCYWLLDRPYQITNEAERKHIVEIQARWVRAMGGDESAKDIARTLRLPGTLNAKYDPPRPVKVIEDWRGNAIYRFDELLWQLERAERLFVPPAPKSPVLPVRIKPKLTPRRVRGLLAWVANQRPGNRNNAVYWAAHRAREMGLSLDQAVGLVGAAGEMTGLQRNESERTVRSAYRRGL